MNIFKHSVLSILAVFSIAECHAYRYEIAVDSIGGITTGHEKLIRQRIGDLDYHQFGKVIMERSADKYYIIFPFTLYMGSPVTTDNPKANGMPEGTQIIIKLANGKVIKSETQEDINVMWYYWHHFSPSGHKRPFNSTNEYLGHQQFPFYLYSAVSNSGYKRSDIFGVCWWLKFEFTPADMQLLSKCRIVDAYTTKNDKKIRLPLKIRQTVKIRNSAASLLNT